MMGEEEEAAWPERSEDLLDQSCVCVIHAPERSRFCFFPYPFSPGPPHSREPHPSFASKPVQHLAIFSMLWFGGFQNT